MAWWFALFQLAKPVRPKRSAQLDLATYLLLGLVETVPLLANKTSDLLSLTLNFRVLIDNSGAHGLGEEHVGVQVLLGLVGILLLLSLLLLALATLIIIIVGGVVCLLGVVSLLVGGSLGLIRLQYIKEYMVSLFRRENSNFSKVQAQRL
jgi:hypothetical protein